MTEKPQHEVGELRQDAITEEWVVIATERAKRPDDFLKDREALRDLPKYKEDCPFCNATKFPQEPDVLRLPDDPHNWKLHIFANKYPAFRPKDEFRTWNVGPHRAIEAVGYHEILATKNHHEVEGRQTRQAFELQIEALLLRYRELKTNPTVNYIHIIKNYGAEAGASLEHPHHQIFTLPILPSDIQRLLRGAEKYAQSHNQKAFTDILDFERSEQERIVFENDHFTAYCPFASRVPFEVWVMPRRSNPFFDDMNHAEQEALAEVMQEVLGRLYTGLQDPPYNYYILSAPCDNSGYVCDASMFPNFRWHIQILPRLTKWAGLELGTGLEINPVPPEQAASFLREQSLPTPIS